ncbi:RNA polymerase sigma factor [Haliangium ochraceum]|uniref:Putative RNA polymerase, sigma-24 subunit, ECF subfamily n=1 Tax=Haliangium ochraceum (strain DSM 14365 / JCM 11303 / SMP-2) TaxID=502025 RepID=D0LSN0_HALO1|nr:sigma-70 family RNA polymerase sigma factor [Haliangium ochraceum]ACY17252.1 putative RNA polymerase, sigma-24 subunit, ECF subfamily [Haliangium ochraceum DSM 14365]
MSQALDSDAQRLLRALTPQVLGAVLRRFGDLPACEDAVQEALLAAARQWPGEGVPDNPRAWLIRVAMRRVADEVRAAVARRQREAIVVSLVPPEEQMVMAADQDPARERDDALELLFLCCHPVLTPSSAIALTLRAVGGLSTFEIARAFLVPEATMAQRISRAKQRIKSSGVSFALPAPEGFAARLRAVLHVLYLTFSEGYLASTGGALSRSDLAAEAVRLTRLLHALLPAHEEVAGLLALMLLTDARRAARVGPAGELIPLDQQDRGRWDRAAIAEGVALISATLPRGALGPYQVQAAIAAVHDEAARAEDTDWPQILALYGLLLDMAPNPMVALNHAIAVAMVHGPQAGLARLDALASDPRMAAHYRLDAVRGHLLERAGRHQDAVAHYLRAAERTTSAAERSYLLTHAARLRDALA